MRFELASQDTVCRGRCLLPIIAGSLKVVHHRNNFHPRCLPGSAVPADPSAVAGWSSLSAPNRASIAATFAAVGRPEPGARAAAAPLANPRFGIASQDCGCMARGCDLPILAGSLKATHHRHNFHPRCLPGSVLSADPALAPPKPPTPEPPKPPPAPVPPPQPLYDKYLPDPESDEEDDGAREEEDDDDFSAPRPVALRRKRKRAAYQRAEMAAKFFAGLKSRKEADVKEDQFQAQQRRLRAQYSKIPDGEERACSEATEFAEGKAKKRRAKRSKVRGEGGAQGGVDRSKRGGSGCGGSGRLGGAGKRASWLGVAKRAR
jgi:hypothetical protein